MYVLEQRLSDPSVCDINELRSCVQILTNKGALNPAQTPICFTPKFGNNIDLARALPSKILFKMSCPAVMYPQLVASIYQLNCYGCLFSPAVVAISATALMFFLLLITFHHLPLISPNPGVIYLLLLINCGKYTNVFHWE